MFHIYSVYSVISVKSTILTVSIEWLGEGLTMIHIWLLFLSEKNSVWWKGFLCIWCSFILTYCFYMAIIFQEILLTLSFKIISTDTT